MVRAIVDVQRNSPNTPNQESGINKSINQESINPPIKQSTNQVSHLREKQNFGPEGIQDSEADTEAFRVLSLPKSGKDLAAYQDSPVAGRR